MIIRHCPQLGIGHSGSPGQTRNYTARNADDVDIGVATSTGLENEVSSHTNLRKGRFDDDREPEEARGDDEAEPNENDPEFGLEDREGDYLSDGEPEEEYDDDDETWEGD